MRERMMIIRLITQLVWFRDYTTYRGVLPSELEPYISNVIQEARNMVDWLPQSDKLCNAKSGIGFVCGLFPHVATPHVAYNHEGAEIYRWQ
jgi:hypothetical protein